MKVENQITTKEFALRRIESSKIFCHNGHNLQSLMKIKNPVSKGFGPWFKKGLIKTILTIHNLHLCVFQFRIRMLFEKINLNKP